MTLITKKCEVCGGEWQCSPDSEASCPHCESRQLKHLFAGLGPERTAEIDALIYERNILIGIKKIKESLGIRLAQSTELFSIRYTELRAANGHRFICSDDCYWDGFYS